MNLRDELMSLCWSATTIFGGVGFGLVAYNHGLAVFQSLAVCAIVSGTVAYAHGRYKSHKND